MTNLDGMTYGIRVALTNLGKYNEGVLDFVWLDLPATEDDIQEAYDAIGIDGERYEETFISDYEAPFSIEEYSSLTKLNEVAEVLDAVTMPAKRFGTYDADEVINFVHELEDDGLINDSAEYIGDIISDEDLDEMVKHQIENDAGWLRIRFFLQDADPDADYHYLDGYSNVARLDSDCLDGIVTDVIEEVRRNI